MADTEQSAAPPVAVAYRLPLAGLGADAGATAGPATAPPAGQPR
jgi:hypothetical protein